MTRDEYAASALCIPATGDSIEFKVGEDDVIEILVVDRGARLVVTKKVANGPIVRIAKNGPFEDVAWRVL